jgi:hypothetical protein
MPFTFGFNYGNKSDEVELPVPGNTYWVVVRTDSIEIVFQAILITSVQRDHLSEKQDQTPSYQFDNGVVLHGLGARFFSKMPSEPKKSLRFLKILPHENGTYTVSGPSEIFPGGFTTLSNIQELRAILKINDIDDRAIPDRVIEAREDFEIMF